MKYILFIILCSISLLSSEKLEVFHNEVMRNIPTESINGQQYINIDNLHLIFPNGEYANKYNEIYYSEGMIRVAAGSFFVFYENDKEIKIAQMSSPAILYKGSIYVPTDTFIRSLISSKILTAEFDGKNIRFNPKFQNKNLLQVLRYRNKKTPTKSLDNSHIVTDTISTIPDINSELKKTTIIKKELPPNHYYLPDGLIRKELSDSNTEQKSRKD